MIVKKMKNYGELTANYVSGSKSPWLITSWHAKGISTGTALLVLPPFYEEMNCCRRLFSSLAWQLTIEGIDTYLPDFYGTGDSSGDFSEISLDLWRRDLLMWLPTLSKYREVHLLGCRLGAALLLDWLVDFKQEVSVGKLLLWQPTLQVDRFWQQLTRQSKFSKNGTLSSKYLEVAGYIIPILLRAELGKLNTTLPSEIKDVLWLESSLNGSLNTAALNALKLNPNLDIRRITCAPYWLTQEVIDTDDLIPASLSFLTEQLPKNESNISNLCKVVNKEILNHTAQVIHISFHGQQTLGIYCHADSQFVVVMINGGAQTRAGSHRMQQKLAQCWQDAGFANLRFDFPGLGDACGNSGGFTNHSRYLSELPAQLQHIFGENKKIVFFGICDGATSALLASQKIKSEGLILVNPWFRITDNHAHAMLKFYYLKKLLSIALWRRLFNGELRIKDSFNDFLSLLLSFISGGIKKVIKPRVPHLDESKKDIDFTSEREEDSVKRALQQWQHVDSPIQLILSGADLTATECKQLFQKKEYKKISKKCEIVEISEANHTLTDSTHFSQLQNATIRFLEKISQKK